MNNVFVVGNSAQISYMYKSMGYRVVNDVDNADIVQFPGGADVDPALYGEHKLDNTYVNKEADARDESYWKRSIGKFRVGICRGGQFLNCKSGGAMWQDVKNHTRNHHIIDLIGSNKEMMGGSTKPAISKIWCTSTHHQMMIPGPDGILIAYADRIGSGHTSANPERKHDGIDTEVMWYPKTRSLCFQPHPEYAGHEQCTQYFFRLLRMFGKE